MKTKIIKTKRPKKILQVFMNKSHYFKDQRSYEDRKNTTAWNEKIESISGHFVDGKLAFPESAYRPDIDRCDLIILSDFNQAPKTPTTDVQFVNLTGRGKKFEIFQIRQPEGAIELHLLYDMFEIGIPKRENFKLCEFKMGVPVEVKINGKLDHTASWHSQRVYYEKCYIFHLIGETDTFQINQSVVEHNKSIPRPVKKVDLMKTLY